MRWLVAAGCCGSHAGSVSPHHHTSSSRPHSQNHVETIVHLFCVAQRHSGWNQRSHTRTHQTKAQISTGLMSILCVSWPKQISSACCFFLQCFFSSCLTIKAWFTQSPLSSWCRDVSATRTLCGTHLGSDLRGCQLVNSEAGDSDELLLSSRGDSCSSFPGAVLMSASFIVALDGFVTALEDTFKVFAIFWTDWPSVLKVMMDCRFSWLSWLVLTIISILTVVK